MTTQRLPRRLLAPAAVCLLLASLARAGGPAPQEPASEPFLPPASTESFLLSLTGGSEEVPVLPPNLPAPFPRPLAPASAVPIEAGAGPWKLPPELIELGRRLFYDERLSVTGNLSCATCHRQELAFTDGKARAVGATGEIHFRSAMTLTNVAYNASYNWADPEVQDLETQALIPLLNEHPVEMGVAGREEEILDRLRQDEHTAARFRQAFPKGAGEISLSTVTRAIAAFERTLISADSPYDRYVFDDDVEALSPAARRGMKLFFSDRLGCSKCHGGFNLSGPVKFEGGPQEGPEGGPTFHNTGLYNVGGSGRYPQEDPGLAVKTRRPEDDGRFRAPTLRNIAVTAPYMHDGSISTLDKVLDHYSAGGRTILQGPHAGIGANHPNKSPLVPGFPLSHEERADVVEFLKSLTDEGFLVDPRFSDPHEPEQEKASDR